eukprot:scaffold501_cov105-Isochrysis_galbana.AAC.7
MSCRSCPPPPRRHPPGWSWWCRQSSTRPPASAGHLRRSRRAAAGPSPRACPDRFWRGCIEPGRRPPESHTSPPSPAVETRLAWGGPSVAPTTRK